MRVLFLKLLFSLTIGLLLNSSLADACTGITLNAKDGSFVNGRTLEFGLVVDISSVVVPRNTQFQATTSNGPGLSYKSKYAAVGAVAFDNVAIMDGMNEKGLTIGTFYFPTFAQYTPTTSENQSKSLSPVDFSNWIVTQFATVEEVKNGLKEVVIAPTVEKAWGSAPPPFHYLVSDKNGKVLVIEPIDGKLVTYDNPIGTFTNSPSFDWHLTNLRNYINLNPYNTDVIKIHGLELKAFGQGSGMFGLPGDFTPPSRFVRAAVFSSAAAPSNNAEEAVLQAFHILNNFDIPVGVAREKTKDGFASDFTQITCVRDPQSLKYYFKTYDDQSIKVVDLTKFDFDAKGIKTLKITGKESYIDVTANFK